MDKPAQTNNNCEITDFLINESVYLDKLIIAFGNVSNNLQTFLTSLHNYFKNCDTHDKILKIEHNLGDFKDLLIELNECILSKVNKTIQLKNSEALPENGTLLHSNNNNNPEIMDLARCSNYPSPDSNNDFFKQNNINKYNVLNTSMGTLLASIIWVFSKQESFVDILLTNKNYLRHFIILCDSTVNNFLILFDKNLPPINSIKFKYVMSICGILTNISAHYKGRQYIMSYKEGLIFIQHVFGYIKMLYTAGNESLRRIFLMFLCNIARHKKGLAFMHFLNKCIIYTVPGLYAENSNHIKLLTLNYLNEILNECPTDICENLKENISDNLLDELKMSGNAQIMEATDILHNLLTNNSNNSFVSN